MKRVGRKAIALALGAVVGVVAYAVIAHLLQPPAQELTLHRLRAGLALVTLVLVAVDARRAAPPWLVRAVSGALCVLSIGAYFGFLSPLDGRVVHRHDIFHYYLGGKYQRELSYTRIYSCTALAQAELGQAEEVKARSIRVLEDDHLASGAEVLAAAPETCRPHFSDARWASFVSDVQLLHADIPAATWTEILADHGYNPPPTWAVAGGALASLHPPTRGFLLVLSRVDLLLAVGMGVAVLWAFGARVLAVFAVFLGCQDPANLEWLGGAFLRLDWLFFLVLSTAALARRRYAVGGAALAASAVLRIFPVILFAGPILAFAARAWRRRRISRGAVRFVAGAAIAASVLVATSAVELGPESWRDFAAHLRTHEQQTTQNNVGLPALLQHDFSGQEDGGPDRTRADAWAGWRAKRIARGHRLRIVQAAGVLLALAALFAARRRPVWATQVLSLPLVATALVLSCYYWVALVLVATLTRVARPLERVVLGSLLAAELLATMPALSGTIDDEYVTQTAVYLVMLALLSTAVLRAPSTPRR